MFKVIITKADGSIHSEVFSHEENDDFISVLPGQYSGQMGELITKDELEIYKFESNKMPLLHAQMKNNNGIGLELIEADKEEILVKAPNGNIIAQFTGVLLNPQWPYDKDGKFLGNK